MRRFREDIWKEDKKSVSIATIVWHYLPDLPEECGTYLITHEGEEDGVRFGPDVTVARYDTEEKTFEDSECFEEYRGVIAWAKMPEPVKIER